MNKTLKYILLCILIIFFLFLFYIFLSPRAFKARKNVRNTENIEIGMSKSKMLEIMGKPDNIYPSYYNDGDSIYFYEPPFMASDGIEIYIAENEIKRIVPYR